jgi:hypothetical protein
MVRIHGTKRAPILIRTYVDGPIMGLNWGWIMIGELVRIAKDRSVIFALAETSGLTVFHNFRNEDSDLDS